MNDFFKNLISSVETTAKAIFSTDTLTKIPGLFVKKDLLFALGIALIIFILIFPMPTWLLDISLSISISVSVLILMTVIFIERPIDFSAFPTVLLISTMLRLSLNLASTRLILAHGHEGMDAAGAVIKAFGLFIMGGNFVIGIIVFAILLIVNFLVITKGSGRIAEVSARFTLDSMPGKQMAIDADLSAGLISEDDAKLRRKELETETNFYGAMDGAAKFVRGDAIAGLLITFINIIAGIIIGVLQEGITLAEASKSYTLLTVGDGLVSQVPSLIVSTASGMLVSKSSANGSIDKALFGQLSAYPSSIGMTAFLLICISLLPGIPKIPFILIAGIIGYLAFSISNLNDKAKDEAENPENAEPQPKTEEEELEENLKMENVKIELGLGLLSLMQNDSKTGLIQKIKILRREVALEMGFIIPQIRIKDNFQNANNEFNIKIKDLTVVKGNIYPGKYMIVNAAGDVDIDGTKDKDPYFKIDVVWVDEAQKEEAEESGYHLIDPASVIITSLNQVMQNYIHEIFSYSDTEELLGKLDQAHQNLLKEISPSQISTSGIQMILQELLSENISIKDLPTILEGIAEVSPFTKNALKITDHVRTKLKRQITSSIMSDDSKIYVLAIEPLIEQNFINSLVGDNDNKHIGCQPIELQKFLTNLNASYQNLIEARGNGALVVSDILRRPIKEITNRSIPELKILSQSEIYERTKIEIFSQIGL